MNEWWAIPMLISGGVFAGGVLSIAWERVPAWRKANLIDSPTAFAHTLCRVDHVQPALLVVCLISTVGFALSSGGQGRTSALVAAAGLLIVLAGSVAWLFPIQRQLVASDTERSAPVLERPRTQWLRGHVVRTVVALASLILVVAAAVS
jgi:Domain of unknown function (DUF1772)